LFYVTAYGVCADLPPTPPVVAITPVEDLLESLSLLLQTARKLDTVVDETNHPKIEAHILSNCASQAFNLQAIIMASKPHMFGSKGETMATTEIRSLLLDEIRQLYVDICEVSKSTPIETWDHLPRLFLSPLSSHDGIIELSKTIRLTKESIHEKIVAFRNGSKSKK
jgi:hypothetical protein